MRLNYLIAMSTLVLLCGCSSDKALDQSTKVVNITGTKVNTSFTDTEGFKSGSKIGVYMTTASSALLASGNHANNAIFTATESGFTPAATLTYPEGVSSVDFYAYSPYSATGIDAAKKLSFTVSDTQTSLTDSDLLWCSKKGNATNVNTAVGLEFDHKLSKIVVNLIAGAGITLSSPTVAVGGVLPTVKLNVESGVLDIAEGVATSITAAKVTETQMHAIVVPQKVVANTVFITVTNGGKTFTHTLPADNIFASGESYSYDITVKDAGIDVTFTGSVNGWTPGGNTTGDAL